jgi:GT2 family glycosyltransferase
MSRLLAEQTPTAVREVHLERIEQGLCGLEGYNQVLAVYRLRNCVVGRSFLPVRNGTVTGEALKEPLSAFAWEIWLQLTKEESGYREPRTASIVVCTRDRTTDLANCILRLLPLIDQGHEIVIVDSSPATEDTARLIASYPEIRYIREPRPGAGLARNRGLLAATHEFVAFTDDDAQVDANWLNSLLQNFDNELVAVVTGITMPLELETEAQVWFEKTNSFSRGFRRQEFHFSNFEPLIAGLVGCSVNMAVRVSALDRIGLFDEALGPGSLAKCGEDHEFYYRALTRGYQIVYDPAALVWHRHRREWPALRRVIYTYGVGVFAWWTGALVKEREFALFKVATLWFLRHHVVNLARALFRRPNSFPLSLAWAEFAGALEGPFAYFKSQRSVSRLQAPPQSGESSSSQLRSLAANQYSGIRVSKRPALSVVIATHNRAKLLESGLHALARQTCLPEAFEVLVVADSCTDHTTALVESFASSAPYRLRLLSHEERSPSASRNLGAKHAEADTILFIDDDLTAAPELLEAHSQLSAPDTVVIGYAKPRLPQVPGLVQLNAAKWWEDRFQEMRRPGYRFSYLDFFSCNISLPTALFHQVGGFDTGFTKPGLEDYELGARLINAGARFCYAHRAIGHHLEITDLRMRARRIWIEGNATVQLCRRHPRLWSSLLWNPTEPPLRVQRIVRSFALSCCTRGDLIEGLIVSQAALLERLRLRRSYRLMMALLYEFNFWRGVSAALGGRRALAALMQEAEPKPAVACDAPVLDIATLPPPSDLEEIMMQENSKGVRLTLDGEELLSIAPQYAAEPLRKEHLDRALNDLARKRFLPALAFRMICSEKGGSPF